MQHTKGVIFVSSPVLSFSVHGCAGDYTLNASIFLYYVHLRNALLISSTLPPNSVSGCRLKNKY